MAPAQLSVAQAGCAMVNFALPTRHYRLDILRGLSVVARAQFTFCEPESRRTPLFRDKKKGRSVSPSPLSGD